MIILCAGGDILSPGRHCLTRQTASLPGQALSHPADSLSGRADNVWPGRQCLTWHTASERLPLWAVRHTQPAVCLTRHTTSLTPQRPVFGTIKKVGLLLSPFTYCYHHLRGQRGCVPGQTAGRVCLTGQRGCVPGETLSARPDIVCPAREAVCRVRQCLPRHIE